MREPVGEPTPWLRPHVVNRPKRALERGQANVSTRPRSSPHQCVERDDKVKSKHVHKERSMRSLTRTTS